MDKRQLIAWVAAALARGIAFVLAAKVGLDAATSNNLGVQAAEALVALGLVVFSVYTSIAGRKKILATPPPKNG